MRGKAIELGFRDAMMSTFGKNGSDPTRVDPPLESGIPDAESFGGVSDGQWCHSASRKNTSIQFESICQDALLTPAPPRAYSRECRIRAQPRGAGEPPLVGRIRTGPEEDLQPPARQLTSQALWRLVDVLVERGLATLFA